jgi:hypothetical protein
MTKSADARSSIEVVGGVGLVLGDALLGDVLGEELVCRSQAV